MKFFGLTFIVLAMLAGCDASPPSDTPAGVADRVFLHGGVYTVDAQQPWAEAVVVRNGEIVFVGSDADAGLWIGDATEIVDLTGRMLLPGFHDSHVHLLDGEGGENYCALFDLPTLEDLRRRLEACRELEGAGEENWLIGGGWDRSFFDGNPGKEFLDEIFGARPVLLDSSDGHSVWVTSRALELAGIDRDTPDIPSGTIVRDPETGEAIGIFDELAREYIDAVMPAPELKDLVDTLRINVAKAHAVGITSIIEPGVDHEHFQPFLVLSRAGELELRVVASISPLYWVAGAFGDDVYDMVEAREQYRGPNLNPDSVKIFMDGVLETGTGLLVEPYIGDFEKYGLGMAHYTQPQLDEYFRRFDAAGLHIHVHAIGDGGVRMALDAFEAAREANGPNDLRHHIVHLQLIHPDDIPRFAELNVGATFQALWAWPDEWVQTINVPTVGQKRVDRMYPINSVLQTGGRIVGGSDWYVTSLNPLDAIETAIRRQEPWTSDGPVLNAEERVDLATMIEAYTINGAYISDQENLVGSVEIGKRADLIVLDRNLFEIPATEINEAQVAMTIFDGDVVYRAAKQE